MAKGSAGSKKFRDALTALGARRKDGVPIRTDVVMAARAAGMKAEEALDVWRRVYPTATPHQVACYYAGGVFDASVKKKLGAIANGKSKAMKGGKKVKK